ncbi:hypothetical protein FOL47_002335 [Perkinsus chesapeaki]|uniref:Uncharacterized protein n=1 Tax=Perkinsus chesapeaki TaxID=330153 RepID=A0A7J6MF64_PERCH|nr:hypothetical protein FOL47_002335 [Perkinsus chesapeaki]
MTVCAPSSTALPWPASSLVPSQSTAGLLPSDAWTGMDNLQREFRRQIEGVWGSIGLSDEERSKRLSTLGQYFKEVYSNVINKEKECRDALERSISDMNKQIVTLSSELEEEVVLEESKSGMSLRRQEAALLPIFNGLKKLHEERLASLKVKYDDIVAARQQLGNLPLPAAPTSVAKRQVDELEALEKETMENAGERLAWVQEAVADLQQLIEEAFRGEWPLIVERPDNEEEEKLKCDPVVPAGLADLHSSLSSQLVDIESIGMPQIKCLRDVERCGILKEEFKAYVDQLLQYCNDVADAREAEASTVYSKIQRLLKELEITGSEVGLPGEDDDVPLDTEGMGSLQTILRRLVETRHDRLLELIECKRRTVEEIVEEIRMSSMEQKALRLKALLALEIGTLTDEEVEMHGTICEVLSERQAVVRPIIRLLGRMEQLFDVKRELEESLRDPERLMARPSLTSGRRSSTSSAGRRTSMQRTRDPGRLLREEKMRNMVSKELPTVQQKLRGRLDDFEEKYGMSLLMRGSVQVDEENGVTVDCSENAAAPLDYVVSVAVELAISRGEFPTIREAHQESRRLLHEAKTHMTSLYEPLVSSLGLLEVSQSTSPTLRSVHESPEQVTPSVEATPSPSPPIAAPSFIQLEPTPNRSPEPQGQWGELLSPSKVITPLYGGAAPHSAGGPGISLIDASCLGDSPPSTQRTTTRSLPQRSYTVSDLREDSASSEDVTFHTPMPFTRSPQLQGGPVRLTLQEQRERLKAAKSTRALDELRVSLEGSLSEALKGSDMRLLLSLTRPCLSDWNGLSGGSRLSSVGPRMYKNQRTKGQQSAATVLSRLIPQAEGNVGPTTPEMEVQAAAAERRSRIKPTVLPGMDRPRRRKAGAHRSYRDEGVEGFVWWCYVLTLSVMFYYKYKIWKRDPEHARVRKEAWQSYYDSIQDYNVDTRTISTMEAPRPSSDGIAIESEGSSESEEKEAAAVADAKAA